MALTCQVDMYGLGIHKEGTQLSGRAFAWRARGPWFKPGLGNRYVLGMDIGMCQGWILCAPRGRLRQHSCILPRELRWYVPPGRCGLSAVTSAWSYRRGILKLGGALYQYLVFFARASKRHHTGGKCVTCCGLNILRNLCCSLRLSYLGIKACTHSQVKSTYFTHPSMGHSWRSHKGCFPLFCPLLGGEIFMFHDQQM